MVIVVLLLLVHHQINILSKKRQWGYVETTLTLRDVIRTNKEGAIVFTSAGNHSTKQLLNTNTSSSAVAGSRGEGGAVAGGIWNLSWSKKWWFKKTSRNIWTKVIQATSDTDKITKKIAIQELENIAVIGSMIKVSVVCVCCSSSSSLISSSYCSFSFLIPRYSALFSFFFVIFFFFFVIFFFFMIKVMKERAKSWWDVDSHSIRIWPFLVLWKFLP